MLDKIKELAIESDVWVNEEWCFHDTINPKTRKFADSIIKEIKGLIKTVYLETDPEHRECLLKLDQLIEDQLC